VSTKAVTVKTAIQGMLDATVVAGTQVTYGLPTRAPERRWACVNDIRWSATEWATNRSRNETFSVSVIINVQVQGGIAATAEAAVIDIADAFEDALAANPGLSGLCITTNFSPRALRAWPIDGAYEAQMDAEVIAVCRP
jgi:hypothetical protein